MTYKPTALALKIDKKSKKFSLFSASNFLALLIQIYLLLLSVVNFNCNTYAFRAPTDCRQYFTGTSGTIKSYNFDGGLMLQSQLYANCIRQELGKKFEVKPMKLLRGHTSITSCNFGGFLTPTVS